MKKAVEFINTIIQIQEIPQIFKWEFINFQSFIIEFNNPNRFVTGN
jgi:hypothetical protein